ncbi:hypothetical protein BD309DRAFT_878232 [Dichomitus squalens]|uniref:Zn(2)-C6 fungal-type domain-containing protein n=2 Tax=Dichomitus squalens TaxID=114155 RepID=R7SKJ2_DICSQ
MDAPHAQPSYLSIDIPDYSIPYAYEDNMFFESPMSAPEMHTYPEASIHRVLTALTVATRSYTLEGAITPISNPAPTRAPSPPPVVDYPFLQFPTLLAGVPVPSASASTSAIPPPAPTMTIAAGQAMFKLNTALGEGGGEGKEPEKKPIMACLFCRDRVRAPALQRDACARNSQCMRRGLVCEYPKESRRGQHKRGARAARVEALASANKVAAHAAKGKERSQSHSLATAVAGPSAVDMAATLRVAQKREQQKRRAADGAVPSENVSGQRVPGTGNESDPTRVEYAMIEDAAQDDYQGDDEEHITKSEWRKTQKAEPCSVLVGSMAVTRQDNLDQKVAIFLNGTLSHEPGFLEIAGDDAYEMWTQGAQTELLVLGDSIQRAFLACKIAKTYKAEGAPKDDSNPNQPQLPAIVAEELMWQSIATVLRPSGPLVLGGALDAYVCPPEVAAYMRTEREERFNRLRQLKSNARPEVELVQDSEEEMVEDSEEESEICDIEVFQLLWAYQQMYVRDTPMATCQD